MTDLATNVLYYGDNLDILHRYLPETCVDLVYLDPPFNSNRSGLLSRPRALATAPRSISDACG
jgi:16S rRNA G966 N2-methylase RsmD